MKKTQIAREVADSLHTSEAAIAAALQESRETLSRLKAAKVELGLTGTMGDSAIARWTESVATLEAAQSAMFESHADCHRVMKLTNIRGVGSTLLPEGHADEGTRAA